ncbi:BamA/TamA family outer membrane protein [Tropicimonas sp. TH_r6]|uniref:BamA/TamA family outer membrane protein n=1 Tax=Tropicimonas sp. TH_r6 TaxID=3082085 RepID=UPI0029543DD4|nr:BamA/TamA family outer membrane protein [Tropicimonas sp. TH_r6]
MNRPQRRGGASAQAFRTGPCRVGSRGFFLSPALGWLAAAVAAVWLPQVSTAQFIHDERQAYGFHSADDESESPGFRNGSVLALPIPSNDPNFGAGLLLAVGYLFKADEKSKSSFIAGGAFKTSNGSLGGGVAADLAFASNRWKATVFLGKVEAYYDLDAFRNPIPLRQDGALGVLKLGYGITPDVSVGLGFRYLDTTIRPDGRRILPREIARDSNMEIASVGVLLEYDTRDDNFYPTAGRNLTFEVYHHDVLSSTRDYQRAVLKLDAFVPINDGSVLAGRFTACSASETSPYFDSCSIGGTDGFRGFSITENIGDQMISVQGSWRGRLGDRFGYEVFGGAGRIWDKRFREEGRPVRFAGGVGLRYRLTRKFPIDLGIDGTMNDAGDATTYLRAGQAF